MPIFEMKQVNKTRFCIRNEKGEKVADVCCTNGELDISINKDGSNKSLEDRVKIKRSLPPVRSLISVELPK